MPFRTRHTLSTHGRGSHAANIGSRSRIAGKVFDNSKARLIAEQVMIAACDTFRSGAVEQLKTHCNRLSIPLYERGYEKDPAKVAYEATMQAARSKTDVVLVDTAGALILGRSRGYLLVGLTSLPSWRVEGHVGRFEGRTRKRGHRRSALLANEVNLGGYLQKDHLQQS